MSTDAGRPLRRGQRHAHSAPAPLAAVLLAAGSAALYPTIMTLVVDRVPDRERGVAMGMVSGAWDLGAFAGSPLIAGVVEHASPARAS